MFSIIVKNSSPLSRANLAKALWPSLGSADSAALLRSAWNCQTTTGSRAKASGVESSFAGWVRHIPPAPRKVAIPEEADRPAPHTARMRRDACKCATKVSTSLKETPTGSAGDGEGRNRSPS
jgi:hypothetical protein